MSNKRAKFVQERERLLSEIMKSLRNDARFEVGMYVSEPSFSSF